MIISSVDIGTNTILLLIAQTDPKNNKIIPLLNEYRIPRIGKNVNSTGKISGEAVEKLKKILLEYRRISTDYGSELILASATAAFRKADNSSEIIDYILHETGIKINIISGEDEARFAYLGVTGGIEDNKSRMIIDIGGGSTEIIIGKNDNLLYIKSFNIGVVTASELYNNSKEPKQEHSTFIDEIFSELMEQDIRFDEGFAIAGTPTTLAAIKLKLAEFSEDVDGSFLTRDDIKDFIRNYSENPEYYNTKFFEVLTGREDIIIPGALILLQIMTNLNMDKVQVSTRGIRHGAIINYLKNQG